VNIKAAPIKEESVKVRKKYTRMLKCKMSARGLAEKGISSCGKARGGLR
jgi:hypothetical protein